MARVAFFILLALPAATHQLTYSYLRSYQKQLIASEASAQKTFAAAANLLEALETDVLHLAKFFSSSSAASLVQLSAELGTNNASQKTTLVASSAPVDASKPKAPKKGINATEAVKQMANLKPQQMPAMLGLITGMYDSWKDKISQANKHEREQKAVFDKTISDLEAKKAQYKDSKDAIATYDRIETYWKRQRSIAHRQYHTALKIMHSGMQKFKAVSTAMGHAIEGKKPTAKDLQTVGMAMPEIVFLQGEVEQLVTWTHGAAQELRAASVQ